MFTHSRVGLENHLPGTLMKIFLCSKLSFLVTVTKGDGVGKYIDKKKQCKLQTFALVVPWIHYRDFIRRYRMGTLHNSPILYPRERISGTQIEITHMISFLLSPSIWSQMTWRKFISVYNTRKMHLSFSYLGALHLTLF